MTTEERLQRIEDGRLPQESRDTNARVDALTSAIGAWIAARPKPPQQ